MRTKYNWKICPRCNLPFIPFRKKQVYCSYLCEMKEEEDGKELKKMTDEEYIAAELAAINMEWKVRKTNDIETNPIDYYWAIGECGILRRFYKIVPWSKTDVRGHVIEADKYFCLYESCQADKPENAGMVGIYESLDDAKERAKVQLVHINNLIKAYCPEK